VRFRHFVQEARVDKTKISVIQALESSTILRERVEKAVRDVLKESISDERLNECLKTPGFVRGLRWEWHLNQPETLSLSLDPSRLSTE
jgi:hypothetical protein